MSDEDLPHLAFDDLFIRNSFANSPWTLAIRNPDPTRLEAVLDAAARLLAGRKSPDEIILLVAVAPMHRPTSRLGLISVRTVVLPTAADGPGLQWLIENAHWPVLVTLDAEVGLSKTDLDRMTESLLSADLIVGRRLGSRPTGVLGRWSDWWIRKAFGVPTRDPFSPFKAIRRESALGVPLESPGSMGDFELIAKMTHLFAIHDDPEISVEAGETTSTWKMLRKEPEALRRLFWRPRFWKKPLLGPPERIRPQDCQSASLQDIARRTDNRAIVRPSLAQRNPFRRPRLRCEVRLRRAK